MVNIKLMYICILINHISTKCEGDRTYKITIKSTWPKFPLGIRPDGVRFSKTLLVSHNPNYRLWE